MNRWVFFFLARVLQPHICTGRKRANHLKMFWLMYSERGEDFQEPQTTPCSDFICPIVLLAFSTQVWKILVTTMGYN